MMRFEFDISPFFRLRLSLLPRFEVRYCFTCYLEFARGEKVLKLFRVVNRQDRTIRYHHAQLDMIPDFCDAARLIPD